MILMLKVGVDIWCCLLVLECQFIFWHLPLTTIHRSLLLSHLYFHCFVTWIFVSNPYRHYILTCSAWFYRPRHIEALCWRFVWIRSDYDSSACFYLLVQYQICSWCVYFNVTIPKNTRFTLDTSFWKTVGVYVFYFYSHYDLYLDFGVDTWYMFCLC